MGEPHLAPNFPSPLEPNKIDNLMTQTNHKWRALAGSTFETTKEMASGSRGVVAANHPLGAAAGLQMLARGGNAIDAAVATLFALNVVEPMMVGLFGAGWTHLRLADGRSVVIDNYSTAPAAATPDLFTPISDEWPDYMQTEGKKNMVGHLACGVPGTLKAWCELVETYGKLDLNTILQPAIDYAQNGYPWRKTFSKLQITRVKT